MTSITPMTPIRSFKYASASLLGKFCSDWHITAQIIADLTGYSKATTHRLLVAELSPEFTKQVNADLLKVLPEWLITNRGMSREQVDEHLASIFPGDYKPMISQKLELTPDVCRYFGLARDPFRYPPQTRDEVFISPPLRQIIDRVVDAVKYPAFVAVMGEIGSGKSTIRALIEDHVENEPDLHLIWPEFMDMSRVTPVQIANAILEHFGEQSGRVATKLGTRLRLLLERKFNDGQRICIAFDECHHLNKSSLRSLKNFFEMSSGGFRRYLGVILFGQPIFETKLAEAEYRELYERIVPLRMPDFGAHAAEYLEHRLQLVGGSVERLFDAEAVDLICRQSTTPQMLGNVTNQAFKVSRELDNKKVIGEAIKTKMHFSRASQGFARR